MCKLQLIFFLCHGIHCVTTVVRDGDVVIVISLKIWDCPRIYNNFHRFYREKAPGPPNKVQIPWKLCKDFSVILLISLDKSLRALPPVPVYVVNYSLCLKCISFPITINLVNPSNILRSHFISSITSFMKSTLIFPPNSGWKSEVFSRVHLSLHFFFISFGPSRKYIL